MGHSKLRRAGGILLVLASVWSASQCASIALEPKATLDEVLVPSTQAEVATTTTTLTQVDLDAITAQKELEAASPLAGLEKKFRRVGELTSRLNEKAPELERLARFIFDIGGNNNNPSFTTSDGTSNLFNLNMDSGRVMEGLFKPEYVAIHVAQNAFNLVTSSVGWVLASALYQNTNSGRSLFSSNSDSYSSSGSSYSIPSFKNPSETYSSPSSSYGAPLLTSKDSFSSGPLSFLSKTIADSPLFNAFSPSKTAKTTYASPTVSNYGARKVKVEEDNEAISAEDPLGEMSVGELQQLLAAEEQGQVNMFKNMSEEQKYQIYQRAKHAMLTGSRRHEMETEPSLTFEDQHLEETNEQLGSDSNVNKPPVVRRRRKLVRKPVDPQGQ